MLRYHQMATKKKLCTLLLLLSITIALIPSQIQNGQYLEVTLRSFALVCSFLLIFASMWIKKVRDRAAEEIRKRNYFGIRGVEFVILQRLKGTMRETIQLSFITAAIIIIAGSLCWRSWIRLLTLRYFGWLLIFSINFICYLLCSLWMTFVYILCAIFHQYCAYVSTIEFCRNRTSSLICNASNSLLNIPQAGE